MPRMEKIPLLAWRLDAAPRAEEDEEEKEEEATATSRFPEKKGNRLVHLSFFPTTPFFLAEKLEKDGERGVSL